MRMRQGEEIQVGAVDELDALIEQFNLAQAEFVKGNAEPMNDLFSHIEDVSLNNPLSPPAHGWEQGASTMVRAASQFRDGEIVGLETIEVHVTPEIAYVVRVWSGPGPRLAEVKTSPRSLCGSR
jgi:hypothetical protein